MKKLLITSFSIILIFSGCSSKSEENRIIYKDNYVPFTFTHNDEFFIYPTIFSGLPHSYLQALGIKYPSIENNSQNEQKAVTINLLATHKDKDSTVNQWLTKYKVFDYFAPKFQSKEKINEIEWEIYSLEDKKVMYITSNSDITKETTNIYGEALNSETDEVIIFIWIDNDNSEFAKKELEKIIRSFKFEKK